MGKLTKNDEDREKYVHISLSELVRLLVHQRNAELLASDDRRAKGLANINIPHHRDAESRHEEICQLSKHLARSKNKNGRLKRSLERLSKELKDGEKGKVEAKSLQKRINNLLHKQLEEKDLTAETERGTQEIEKKVSLLADHIERLMLHLKHETMDKAKAQALEGRMIREMELLRARNDTIVSKNQRRDRVIVELQEGERILEVCMIQRYSVVTQSNGVSNTPLLPS